MPCYEFKKADGEIVELRMSFEEFDKRVKDGVVTLPDGSTAHYFWNGHAGISTVPSNYPMVCTAAGVHPDQVQSHMAFLRSRGCGQVNHTKEGDIIFEDKKQRKKVLEALGFFDRNGGYSDPAPVRMTQNVRRFR